MKHAIFWLQMDACGEPRLHVKKSLNLRKRLFFSASSSSGSQSSELQASEAGGVLKGYIRVILIIAILSRAAWRHWTRFDLSILLYLFDSRLRKGASLKSHLMVSAVCTAGSVAFCSSCVGDLPSDGIAVFSNALREDASEKQKHVN